MRGGRSIRLRATLLTCCLLVGVIVVFGAAAYLEVRQAALESSGNRLRMASANLAAMLTRTAENLDAQFAELAARPELRAYLSDPSPSAEQAALALLRPAAENRLQLGHGLRDSTGNRVLASAQGFPEPPDSLFEGDAGAARVVIGPMLVFGDRVIFPHIGRIESGGALLGYIVRWQALTGTRQDQAGLQDLIGPGTEVHLANLDGGVWTDLIRPVEPLPVDLSGNEATRVQIAGRGEALAAASPIIGTPWAVIVDFPVDRVLADARGMVGWFLLVGLVLLVTAAATAWVLTGRLTGSIAELSTAAAAISGGDYSHRATVSTRDELGILASSFNRMAENVAQAHQELEAKVGQLAASQIENQETADRLERVLVSSRSIIYTLRIEDGRPRLTWMSNNVEWLLGYSVTQAPRPGWWLSRVHPDDRVLVRESWARTLATGHSSQEYRFRQADGGFRWLRDEQQMLRQEEGRTSDLGGAAEIVGTVMDVTDRRHLQVAKEAAEAANLEKSAFLSRMSHELRTPMNAILGFAQLLHQEVPDEENRESAQQILRGGRHLLRLIDEVLDLAKVESGRMALSVEPVGASVVIQECLELVRGMAAQRRVSLDVEPTTHFVSADQQRLKQILLNLLSNAIKYNRPGGSVTVSTTLVRPGRVRISIADTGPGIPPEAVSRLFTPFDRLGAEGTEIEGTGLGLSLSKGLAEAMGGMMGVESVPDEGSTFWIELNAAERPGETVPEVAVATPQRAILDGAKRRILYIEDNVSNLQLVERIFSRQPNLQIIPAMQGRIGLELAREHQPDLILLDVHLPDIMGQEVLSMLKRDPRLRDIPVVVISADATPRQIAELRERGARAYVTKPFEIDRLMAAVTEALENGGMG